MLLPPLKARTLSMCVLMAAAIASTACSMAIGAPQSRAEFVYMVKNKAFLTSTETFISEKKIVQLQKIAEQYKKACLDVVIYTKVQREAGGTTEYINTITPIDNGGFSLAMQERYDGRDLKGAPPGGLYSFVAEFTPINGQQSRVDLYMAPLKGKVGMGLKRWIETNTTACPSW